MSLIDPSDLIGRAPNGRKLIAVVFADMVDYSRLLGLDDIGTLERLRTLRRLLIDPAISDHGGRLVSTAGDSLFIEFDSIDGAMRCALTIQRQIPEYDGDAPPDRTIRFRVGINIADVIADGTNLHGDGVNVAARLQAECPPGAICVSRAVRDHMLGQPDLAFEPLGPLNLKNIANPVEAFVLRVNHTVLAAPGIPPLVLATPPVPASLERPSIAVLAFTNLSGDLDQEYFSDGMADDIITELSRNRSLFVIARNSSFTYKGRSIDVKQVAKELGVRYVVEGSLRRGGSGVRITARLVDAESGHHLWSERFDCADTKLFEVQDCIANAVTAAVHPAIAQAEVRRALRKPPENLGAWELYQLGLWHFRKYNTADNERAIDFFQRAIAQNEMFVPPHLGLAWAYVVSGQVYAERALDETVRLAAIWTHKAAEIDPQDPNVQIALGYIAHFSGRGDEAWECAASALAISPNSVQGMTLKGQLSVFNGRPTEGKKDLLNALQLDPLHRRENAGRGTLITIAYYHERDYAAATEAARQTIARYPAERFPNTVMPYRWLAASLGQLGRTSEAQQALRTAMAVAPKAFDLFVRNRVPWHRPQDYEHMLEGLRKAGWQE